MKENNIKEYKEYCAGCGACFAVCPKNAIEYKLNKDGFYEASVIEEKCIHCGKCKKVCAKKPNSSIRDILGGKLYSAKTINRETLNKCTSGGIAYEIGKYGIANGYELVGVIYNYDSNTAETIITNNNEGLEKLVGSKYIQSNTAKAFFELIKKLKENEKMKVIAFGTPCQIYGLRNLILQENIKNEIIYVDLFCHGVPSYLVWELYLKEIKEKKKISEITNINFRDKKYGWHNFTMKIESNEYKYYHKGERDDFYKIFFDNILLNQACQKCNLRKASSSADIRLGDFWGDKFKNDYKGISAVLIMSEKGKELFEKILPNIQIINEEVLDEMLKSQSTRDYNNNLLYEKSIKKIKEKQNLKNTIKSYRKELGKKYIIKQNIKTIVSFFPKEMKTKIKSIYKGTN